MKMRISSLIIITCLTACVSRPVKLTAHSTDLDGIITQTIQFKLDKQAHQWICYSEIVNQVIQGISCQNDTSLPLFSGGLVGDEFRFEYPSRLLLKIDPKNILSYIKMSLFNHLEYNKKWISLVKHQNSTQIIDSKRKVELTITII